MLTEKQRGVLGGMMPGLAATLLALEFAIVSAPRSLLLHENNADSRNASSIKDAPSHKPHHTSSKSNPISAAGALCISRPTET